MIKCLIVDDEPLGIKVIENHINKADGFSVVKTFENALDASEYLRNNQVDIMFLDINMPQLSGMEMLKILESPPLVVITTAHQEYAIDSFEFNVIDYLIKPVSFPRFMKTINKIHKLYSVKAPSDVEKTGVGLAESDEIIFLKVDKKIIKIFFNEILFIESLKDYVRVITEHGNYITHMNLNKITTSLPETKFLRIHRSYTIALDKIKAIDGNSIEIANKSIPIGRNYLKDAKKKILNLGIYKPD